MQLDVLVLDFAQAPLDKEVTEPAALAVHADFYAVVGQHLGEIGTGELAALVGIGGLWWLVPGNRFF